MINKRIFFLLSMIFIGFSSISCSDDETSEVAPQKKYPLTAFAVKVGNSFYHGKIDQTTHKVEIGSITDAKLITDVDYTLFDEQTTISPDPKTFIDNWEKEQTVTVTTTDGAKTIYTIILTKIDKELTEFLFNDDFNIDGNPDSNKWVLCQKGSPDWCDEMSESYEQAYVEDGKLILKAELVDGVYKAGGIETNGKFNFVYGKVEIKARITAYPNGAFPAIWMMPQSSVYGGWPQSGEIDIMEHIKQDPVIYHTIHTHYTDDLGNTADPSNTRQMSCEFGDWIIYGVEKTAEKVTFYVNGEETFSYPNLYLEDEAEMKQWPFTENNPFYIILNMGLGGRENSWAGPIDDAHLPAIMEIDWVRVSKLDE